LKQLLATQRLAVNRRCFKLLMLSMALMQCPATAIDHRDAFQFVDFMASR
jgi:hypothetical protein